MFERFRRVTQPAGGQVAAIIDQASAQDTLGALDDAQVMELASNVYWTLFEQFVVLDGEKTTVPSQVRVN